MADDYSIRVRLLAEIQSYKDGLNQAATATREFGRNVSGMGDAASVDIERVGRSALVMSAGLTASLGLAAKAAIDWESAWAGVTKTVDGTNQQLTELEDGLRQMATELPATHAEIAAVAEAAGQLGVAVEDVEEFTRVMIDLGETTNLTSDEAATSIAQMMNIMQSAPEDVERLASTLVLLGNNGASTERDILDLSLRLAGAGELIGATEGEVLALANAMASLGIESQLGGGAMSRTILKMYTAVQEGSEALEVFADTAGMSAEAFATAFRDDPVAAIDEFIQGMGRIQTEGGNLVAVLKDVGLSGTQDAQVLLRLAGAGDLLTQSLVMQEEAWRENTALSEEAQKRYETTAAQMSVLRNQITDTAISFGEVMLPAIKATVEMLGLLVVGFGQLPGPLQTVGVLMAGFGAAAFGAVGIVGTMAPKVIAAKQSLEQMGRAGQFAARNMRTLATAGAAATAAFAAFSMYQGLEEKARQFGESFRQQATAALDGATSFAHFAAELENVDVQAQNLSDTISGSQAPWDSDKREQMIQQRNALREVSAEYAPFIDKVNALAESTGVSHDEALALVRAQEALAASAGDTAVDLDALAASMSPEQTKDLATALGVTEDQLLDVADATKAADEAFKNYQSTLAASLNPLFGAIDAMSDLEDAQNDVTSAFWGLDAAQKAYNDAVREHGPRSQEATDAAWDLVAAQEALEDAQQNTVRAAYDVDLAMTELAIGVESGTVKIGDAKTQLDEWTASGLITEEQAAAVKTQFDEVGEAADRLDGRKVTLTINAALEGTGRTLGSLLHQDFGTSSTGGSGGGGTQRRALGGPVVPGSDYVIGENGPEFLRMNPFGGGTVYPTVAHSAASASSASAASGSGGAQVNLNVQGTKIGPGEIDQLADQVLRTAGWALSLAGAA